MKASLFLSSILALFITHFSLHASESNILWHNSTTGAVKIMPINEMNPALDFSVVDSSNINLVPRGMGDFTGEGNPDILFHNQNSGNLRIWKMNGAAKIDNIQILGSSNTNLKIAGVGDFDGDGDNDIATFNTNSGALRIWVMEGAVRVDNVLVLTGANVNLVARGAGDMDSDGIPDIVLRNNNSGAVRVWTMNDDFTRKGNEYVTGSSNTNLELRGVVDINGDGNNDILNYNTNTGKLRAWLMDGYLAITENAEITQDVDLQWSVRGGGEMIAHVSEIAEIWRIYFTRTGESEGEEEYLYLSLIEDALNSLSEYEGAAVANPVTLNGSNIDFTYQAGERDWNITGTIGSAAMNGTWSDNYSEQSGTWRAVKGLITEDLKPVIYETGNIVMEWNHEDDSTLVTFYGTIPPNDEEPVFTGFIFDLNGTEEGMLDIALDEQERMTTSSLGGVDLELSYNTDGTFNYEIYSDGSLTYSGSNLAYVSEGSSSSDALSVYSSSDLTYIPTSATSKQIDLNSVSDLQGVEVLGGVESAAVSSTTLDFRLVVAQMGKFYRYSFLERKRKSDFLYSLYNNKELNTMLVQLSTFTTLRIYHFKQLDTECDDLLFQEKCNDNNDKVKKLWNAYEELQLNAFSDLVDKLYDQFDGELCTDTDRDGFYAQKDCGTKVDCDDNNYHINPKASEVCDDGIDNNCNGDIDCADYTCDAASNPCCVCGEFEAMVDGSYKNYYHENIKKEAQLRETVNDMKAARVCPLTSENDETINIPREHPDGNYMMCYYGYGDYYGYGSFSQGTYVNDMLDGIGAIFYGNGDVQVYETHKEDELDGLRIRVQENGYITSAAVYNKGQLEWSQYPTDTYWGYYIYDLSTSLYSDISLSVNFTDENRISRVIEYKNGTYSRDMHFDDTCWMTTCNLYENNALIGSCMPEL